MQGLRFTGRLPEMLGVRPDVVDLLQEHPAGDPAPDGTHLVSREIDAGGRAQGPEDDTDVGPVFPRVQSRHPRLDMAPVGMGGDP